MIEPFTQIVGSDSPKPPIDVGDKNPRKGVVYFIAAPDKIKIGYSTNLARRFGNIATASPEHLTMIGSVGGTRAMERALHALLQAHRVNGEWFRNCPEVQEVIQGVIQTGQFPQPQNGGKRVISPLVDWAANALRIIAAPQYRENVNVVVQRAADRIGFSYWRTFDLWYRKARRLEDHERKAIDRVVGAQP